MNSEKLETLKMKICNTPAKEEAQLKCLFRISENAEETVIY